MFDWLKNIGDWLVSVLQPIFKFFESAIHGFQTLFKSFPVISNIVSSVVGYLPTIFATFISISLIILIIYLIIGRTSGGK